MELDERISVFDEERPKLVALLETRRLWKGKVQFPIVRFVRAQYFPFPRINYNPLFHSEIQ